MFKKFACAVAVVLVGSLAMAETIRGVITKVDDKGITITARKRGETGEAKTYPFAATYTIQKMKGKEDKEKVQLSDLKDAVKKASEGKGKRKGLFASIEVKDGKVTDVTYGGGRRKGKRKGSD
jgi:hypothetical protein